MRTCMYVCYLLQADIVCGRQNSVPAGRGFFFCFYFILCRFFFPFESTDRSWPGHVTVTVTAVAIFGRRRFEQISLSLMVPKWEACCDSDRDFNRDWAWAWAWGKHWQNANFFVSVCEGTPRVKLRTSLSAGLSFILAWAELILGLAYSIQLFAACADLISVQLCLFYARPGILSILFMCVK
jgi:hypothetical protein